jgi:hypothetical protein
MACRFYCEESPEQGGSGLAERRRRRKIEPFFSICFTARQLNFFRTTRPQPPMNLTRTAYGTWSGGKFMHFGEMLDDARYIQMIRDSSVAICR